jgi:hypothetical protein
MAEEAGGGGQREQPATVPVAFDGGPADRCFAYLSAREDQPLLDVVLVAMLAGHAVAFDPPQTAPEVLAAVEESGVGWTRYLRVSQEMLDGAFRYVVDPVQPDQRAAQNGDPARTGS